MKGSIVERTKHSQLDDKIFPFSFSEITKRTLTLLCFAWLSFFTGKTFCQSCKKKCSGEVLRVQDKYFHIGCFKCAQCNASLAQGGFFAREGSYYCTKVRFLLRNLSRDIVYKDLIFLPRTGLSRTLGHEMCRVRRVRRGRRCYGWREACLSSKLFSLSKMQTAVAWTRNESVSGTRYVYLIESRLLHHRDRNEKK